MKELVELLGEALPDDHARQIVLPREAARIARARPGLRVLDLGCGDGRALRRFERQAPETVYAGVDIEGSAEVLSRKIEDPRFSTYDGINLPYGDASFELIFTQSVFEHVRHPEPLLAEMLRVLEPGGMVLGSCSFLEPYHSRSIFCYSPYGMLTILKDAGFEAVRLRPGIDGVTLSLRAVLGRRRFFQRWFRAESPVNRLIGWRGRRRGASPREINAAKLAVAGHLIFEARRPGAAPSPSQTETTP